MCLPLRKPGENPAFGAACTTDFQYFQHAITQGNKPSASGSLAVGIEDNTIGPINVLDAHPVEFASVPHPGITHDHNDVPQWLFCVGKKLTFGLVIEFQSPSGLFEQFELGDVVQQFAFFGLAQYAAQGAERIVAVGGRARKAQRLSIIIYFKQNRFTLSKSMQSS